MARLMILSSVKFPSTMKSALFPAFFARSMTVKPSSVVRSRLVTTTPGAHFSSSASPSPPSPVTPQTSYPAREKCEESSSANVSLLSRMSIFFIHLSSKNR